MQLSVLLFASYAEAFDSDRVDVDVPAGAVAGDVVTALRARPGGATLPPQPMVAINRRHVRPDHPVSPGDEVAVIPPVAGG